MPVGGNPKDNALHAFIIPKSGNRFSDKMMMHYKKEGKQP
ncbi:hypothetical protein Z950_362 [Sulfitobacter mediterraneus KCTC 32188]|nr:hypothetical protein Z950_362 [Sulfitobacter mediterraneus KCTC 32188]